MAAKTPTTNIVPPTTSSLVLVSGEFPAFGVDIVTETETSVTFKVDPKTLRMIRVPKTKTKTRQVRIDRTEYVTREFPAGEAVLNKRITGLAVALAVRLVEDGAKNVRIYTQDGQYNRPINGHDLRRVKPKTKKAA